MKRHLRALGALVMAIALGAVFSASAFAYDVSSEITAMGSDALNDLGPNITAALGVGILIFGALFAAGLIWPALRQAKKGKSGG